MTQYEALELEVIRFDTEDVIEFSGEGQPIGGGN
jgi:hypothetical protein